MHIYVEGKVFDTDDIVAISDVHWKTRQDDPSYNKAYFNVTLKYTTISIEIFYDQILNKDGPNSKHVEKHVFQAIKDSAINNALNARDFIINHWTGKDKNEIPTFKSGY